MTFSLLLIFFRYLYIIHLQIFTCIYFLLHFKEIQFDLIKQRYYVVNIPMNFILSTVRVLPTEGVGSLYFDENNGEGDLMARRGRLTGQHSLCDQEYCSCQKGRYRLLIFQVVSDHYYHSETIKCQCNESWKKVDFSQLDQQHQWDITIVRIQIFSHPCQICFCYFLQMKISNCKEVELSKDMFLLKAENSNLKNLTIQHIGLLTLNIGSLAFQKSVSVSLLDVKRIKFRYEIININITERETLIQF